MPRRKSLVPIEGTSIHQVVMEAVVDDEVRRLRPYFLCVNDDWPTVRCEYEQAIRDPATAMPAPATAV